MVKMKPAGAGILLYSAGIFFFAVSDAVGKWLVVDYGPAQIMALRTLGVLPILAGVVLRGGITILPRRRWGLQLLRVVVASIDTFAFYCACRALPLVDVMTYYLAAPLFVVALSALALGEYVDARRWAAVSVGFVGVVIALRPSSAAISWSALIALGGSAMFAANMTMTRRLRDMHWLSLVLIQLIGSGIVGGTVAVASWVPTSPAVILSMALLGLMSMACFGAITRALALAPASLLAPLQYASIVWAALIGWLVWGDVPSATTLAGIAIIVGSGLFVIGSATLRVERGPGAVPVREAASRDLLDHPSAGSG